MITGTFLGLLKFSIFVLSAGTSSVVEGGAKALEKTIDNIELISKWAERV